MIDSPRNQELRAASLLSSLAGKFKYYMFLKGIMPGRTRGKPGEALMSLPKEQRELLKNLKSSDAEKERTDV